MADCELEEQVLFSEDDKNKTGAGRYAVSEKQAAGKRATLLIVCAGLCILVHILGSWVIALTSHK